MHITAEQILIAEARGCRFQAATASQVHTLSMQRRIFWRGTQAMVALRRDGFYETAATLQQLLDLPVLDLPVAEPPDVPEASPPQPASPEALSPALTAPMQVETAMPLPPAVMPASPARATLVPTADMVSALLASKAVSPQDLPGLIRTVHASIMQLSATRRS